MRKPRGFGRDVFKDIVDKRVHDTHGFAGDTGVGVHLFRHFVDIDRIALLSLASLLFSCQGPSGLI